MLSLTLQYLENMLRQAIFDFSVSGYRLCSLCDRVLIPVMSPAVAYQDAAHFFDLSDELNSLHATRSSPTR